MSVQKLNESGSAGVRHTGAAAFVLVMPNVFVGIVE